MVSFRIPHFFELIAHYSLLYGVSKVDQLVVTNINFFVVVVVCHLLKNSIQCFGHFMHAFWPEDYFVYLQNESGGRQFAWTPLQIPKIKLSEPGVVASSPIKFATPTKKPSGNARRKPANPRKAIKNSATVNFNGNSPANSPTKDFDAITLFQCKYCENTFTSKTGLQNHIFSQHKDHTQKQFACDKCPKRFMTYGSLHRHKNAHKGIYAHKCPICEKGFANGKDLEGHMYKHTGVKPFQCTGCEMTFAYKCNLMSHIKTMHKNNIEMVWKRLIL